jgi:hypothetical protein
MAARCVPASTRILAGVDLPALRASTLWARLPGSARELAEQFAGANYLLIASSGQDLLIAASGEFREPMRGASMLAQGLAVSGTPEAVRVAGEQLRAGRTGAPDLVAWASDRAAKYPLWVLARGTASLPVSGNLANLNRFLHSTEYTAAGVQYGPRLTLDVSAVCASPEAAQRLDETLRAFLSLAAAAQSKLPAGGPMESIRFRVEGSVLVVSMSAVPGDLDPLWH